MDLARAPCRAPLTARKKGSGYENECEHELCKMATKTTKCSPGDKDEEKLVPRLLRDHVKFPHPGTLRKCQISYFSPPSGRQTMSNPPGMPGPPPLGLNIDKCITAQTHLIRSHSSSHLMTLPKTGDKI